MRRIPDVAVCLTLAVALLLAPRCASASEGYRDDSARHLTVGLAVSALTYAALPMVWPAAPEWAPFAVGIGAGTLAGLAKEGADLLGLGTPELADLLWTVGGSVAGAMLGDLLIRRLPLVVAGRWREAVGLQLSVTIQI